MGAATKRTDWVACLKQARERERLRISRLLHDEVGQVLSALGLQLELLRMDLSDVPAAAERIAGTQKLLASALEQVRELSYELNPAMVERLGLRASLERLIGRHRRNFPGELRWSYEGDPQAQTLQAAALYRIAELALDNAVRHSGATRISLEASAGADGARLEVRDNGRGFDCAEVLHRSAAPGLRLMQYEAAVAGLEFRLASEPEKGTIVTAWWSPPAARSEPRRAATRRPTRPGGKR